MSGLFKLCGAALLFAAVSLIFRERYNTFSVLISAAAAVVIFSGLTDALVTAVSFMKDITDGTSASEYVPVLLKGIAFVFLTEAAAGICRTAGEERISSAVRIACRCEILALSVPYLKKLVETAIGMLK